MDAEDRTPAAERLIGEIAVQWGLLSSTDLVRAQWEVSTRLARGESVCLEQLLVQRRLVRSGELPDLIREEAWRASGPEVLRRFSIASFLGEGSMARVYRAVEAGTDRAVAIKILKDLGDRTDRVRARFAREILAVRKLSHPAIVRLHDAGEEGGRMFLVMDLVEGRSFKSEIEDGAGRRGELRAILARVARGVEHAHGRGVIHRDLKPSNVRVDPRGRPTILDFGLARVEKASSTLTRQGTILGTPLYMSPEQFAGDPKRVGPPTDVYSLGTILYEILSGANPHAGRTAAEIEELISRMPPVPPSETAEGVDPGLEGLALRALAKEPVDRPTAAEFAATLEG